MITERTGTLAITGRAEICEKYHHMNIFIICVYEVIDNYLLRLVCDVIQDMGGSGSIKGHGRIREY